MIIYIRVRRYSEGKVGDESKSWIIKGFVYFIRRLDGISRVLGSYWKILSGGVFYNICILEKIILVVM